MFGWLRGAKVRKVWAEIGAGSDKRRAKDILASRRGDFPDGTRCRITKRRNFFPVECHIAEPLAERLVATGEVIDYR